LSEIKDRSLAGFGSSRYPRLTPTTARDRYDEDFDLWTRRQGAALRRFVPRPSQSPNIEDML
jgi:hypothetical protein